MIGAGIFALTGQMAEMTGALFPLAFFGAAIVVAFSSYSYIKMSQQYPSAGGIAMFLEKAYGRGLTTAFHALLMYFSMVIAQSFLARTFGAYAVQLFEDVDQELLVPIIGVGLIITAFILNLLSNRFIEVVASILAAVKIVGIAVFALTGIWVADSFGISTPTNGASGLDITGFFGATALGILAFKGFTTITNSGSELVNPTRNVGRAIIISIAICIVVYVLVGLAVAGNLPLAEIIRTKNHSLAAAARPALGDTGVWFTVILAMSATAGGLIASIFAVSRMLAMLTEMKLVPHRHFGMPGSIQKHTLVYTVTIGLVLTAFFDLSRIAALGIVFYLVMDMGVHWGLLRYLRKEVKAKAWILILAIALDLIVLSAFVYEKAVTDSMILVVTFGLMGAILLLEYVFLRRVGSATNDSQAEHDSIE